MQGRVGDGRRAAEDGDRAAVDQDLAGRVAADGDRVVGSVAENRQDAGPGKEGRGDGHECPRDLHAGRDDIAGIVCRGAVVHLVADCPGRCRRVVAAVEVGHRTQGRLVVGHARLAAQGQHAGGAVVAAGDPVLVGEAQHVLAGGKVAADRHRRTSEVGAVGIGCREHRVDRRCGLVLGVTQRASGQHPGPALGC